MAATTATSFGATAGESLAGQLPDFFRFLIGEAKSIVNSSPPQGAYVPVAVPRNQLSAS